MLQVVLARIAAAVALYLIAGLALGWAQQSNEAGSPQTAAETPPGWTPPPPTEDTRDLPREDEQQQGRPAPGISGVVKRWDN
ncbi:MAG: hypothetical protein U5J83_17090 [Bryobacterales bacterium]|nr:hypothetical protein [Bryobacterales bacterium]